MRFSMCAAFDPGSLITRSIGHPAKES
jgi:hypothetical protein